MSTSVQPDYSDLPDKITIVVRTIHFDRTHVECVSMSDEKHQLELNHPEKEVTERLATFIEAFRWVSNYDSNVTEEEVRELVTNQ
jgi:hypothetical protein